MSIKNFIIYSTIFSVFSEAIYFTYVIDYKLFYLILVLNTFLMCFVKEIVFSKRIILLLLYLLISGSLSVLAGTNTLLRVTSQVVGISFVSFYYYNYFNLIEIDIKKIFNIYTFFAIIISGLGLIICLVHSVIRMEFIPVKSIMLEPAHFVTAVLPALYFQIKDKDSHNYWIKVCILLSAIILSGSSVGVLGLLLIVFLLPKRINPIRVVLPLILSSICAIVLYSTFPAFKLRVVDTANSFVNKDVSGANLSSFSLISNYLVAYESFKSNPVFGSGIGSHMISHAKEIEKIEGIGEFTEFLELNSQDANSLFIRTASELGIIGLGLIFYFIFSNYSSYNDDALWISRAILLYFFCKLLREGHYFSPEMYFFIFIYWRNFKDTYKSKLKLQL
jgi:hypothetical protein